MEQHGRVYIGSDGQKATAAAAVYRNGQTDSAAQTVIGSVVCVCIREEGRTKGVITLSTNRKSRIDA